MKWCAIRILILAVILAMLRLGGSNSEPRAAALTRTERPKLVIMLVIDQFRYDYLERFRPYFVARGFNLLLGGANFVDCRYDYASIVTCPGHATLFTGAYSNVHGIIENNWYDSSLHRMVYCAEDPNTTSVGGTPGPGFSPRNLIGTTIGDELRMATDFQSKVISISLKDRSSIMPGGHTANAAYWYEEGTGRFVTSTYYMQTLPAWVARFDDAGPAKPYCGKTWQTLPETPGAGSKILKQFNPQPNEPCPGGRFLGWLHGTPYMNEIQLNFAREAIKNEGLGQGDRTDLLAMSLSANDIIGHAFGPYSPEVADTTLQTDRYLADFFAAVDQMVGLDNVWVTLSADHGVAPTPLYVKEHRLGLGRVSKTTALADVIEQALSDAFGQDEWLEHVTHFYINLNLSTIKKHHVERATVEAVAAEAVVSVPGVLAAFTRTQLLTGNLPHTPLARKASNSFNSRRSGDVFLILDPYAVPVSEDTHTAHGSPWSYDAQVPLVLWGKAFKPGVYTTRAQPIDLAATLAAALALSQPSGSEGRPLVEALN